MRWPQSPARLEGKDRKGVWGVPGVPVACGNLHPRLRTSARKRASERQDRSRRARWHHPPIAGPAGRQRKKRCVGRSWGSGCLRQPPPQATNVRPQAGFGAPRSESESALASPPHRRPGWKTKKEKVCGAFLGFRLPAARESRDDDRTPSARRSRWRRNRVRGSYFRFHTTSSSTGL